MAEVGMLKSNDTVKDVFVESRYGWFGWTPEWLQRINRPRWLLMCLCSYTLMQNVIINGFINVVISTLERRFELPSTKTGLIASTYDISTAVLVVFVSYYGEKGHKARWLAFGCMITAVGSVVFALPHFLTGLHTTNSEASLLCDSKDECEGASVTSLSNYFYVFVLSQIVHGIGCTPLYTLGVSLLDESVNVHQSSFYLAIFFSMGTIGAAAGFIGGGALLNIYTDIGLVDLASIDVTPADPDWVGAWWLGFIIGGISLFIIAIPLSGFPKELPSTPQIRAKRVSQAHMSSSGSEEVCNNPSFGNKLSDFPKAVKYLCCNPPFVFLALTGCAEGMILSGMATFGSKVIETQFGKTAGEASLLMGVCTIPGGIFGTFLGGYLCKRWKLKVRGMIKLSMASIIIALAALSGSLLRCSQEYVVGVNLGYNGDVVNTARTLLENNCNNDCECSRQDFEPVCGDNGLEYFNPCFAGCTEKLENGKSFAGCPCLKLADRNSTLTAVSGKCPKDCGYLILFLVAFVVAMIFHFMTGIPGFSSLLRCVPESQRSLALGVNWILVRILGTIPGPIIYGLTLDTSCILWQEDCKGNRGSCFLYDAKTISWKIFLLNFGLQFIALVFFMMALWSYRSPKDDNDNKTKEHETTKGKHSDRYDDINREQFQNGQVIDRMISHSSQTGIIVNESSPE